MRCALFSLVVALNAAFAMAVAPHRSVIISWANDAPDHLLAAAKEAIKEAGGQVTQEYTIINGFAAAVPASVLEFVSSLSEEFKCEIEYDEVVTTQEV